MRGALSKVKLFQNGLQFTNSVKYFHATGSNLTIMRLIRIQIHLTIN